MNNRGWISLHRQMQNHWLWDDKPFSKGQAWMDLLMMANHQDHKFLLGNELIKVSRGSFITSELKLMNRWGWSKTKVRNFLKLLEADEMIIKKSDHKKTTITICKYNDYQNSENYKETKEELEKDHGKTSGKLGEDTNNNDNNENNDICSPKENEPKKEESLKFPMDSIEYRLADFLRKWIKRNNPLAKVPEDADMDKWSQHIDYMIRLDHRDARDIQEVIEFCQKDDFWMSNILSPAKLRSKFDQLYLKSQQKNKSHIHLVNQQPKRKTKFHLSKSRGDKYTADELEQLILSNQKKRINQNYLKEVIENVE